MATVDTATADTATVDTVAVDTATAGAADVRMEVAADGAVADDLMRAKSHTPSILTDKVQEWLPSTSILITQLAVHVTS